MSPFIVGISGPKDHGKSTLAKNLAVEIKNLLFECHIEHVAVPMYRMMAIFTGDDDFINDPEKAKHKVYTFEKGSFTGTELLQDVAQRYARDFFGDGTWIDLWEKKIAKFDPDSIVLFPDCRTPQDRDACDYGIWIESPGTVTKQNTNHKTESYLGEMRERCDVYVVRHGENYTPSIRRIAAMVAVEKMKSEITLALGNLT